MYIPCEASSWTLLHQNRKLSSVILLNPVVAYLILCGFPPLFLERTWWRLFQKRVVPTWHVHTLRSVFVNSPPPKPEAILTNFFAEPTVLLVPITSRVFRIFPHIYSHEYYAVANASTIKNMYSLFLYMKCNSHKINRPTKNMTKIVTLLHF
jgi:hypothetical protein